MAKKALMIPLACLLIAGVASAKAPEWAMGAKFGAGPVLAGRKPQQAALHITGGLWVERTISAKDAVFAEGTYTNFKADNHEVTQFGPGYYPGGTGVLTVNRSVDLRKDQLEGVALNLGYRRALTPELSVHAGIGINVWNSQQEVLGQLSIQKTATDPASTPSLWVEGLNYLPGKHSVKPSAFVGVRQAMTANAFVEANLRVAPYAQVNYVPFAYTGQAATTETVNKSKTTLDICIGIRF